MTGYLYELHDGLLHPTKHATGPWSSDAQHGAAVSALMARAVEQAPSAVPMQMTQLSIDLTRKVPFGPLRTEVDILRDGRRVQSLAVRLLAGGSEVSRATAVRIRVEEGAAEGPRVGVPYDVDTPPAPPETGRLVPNGPDHALFDLFEIRDLSVGPEGHYIWWFRFFGEIVAGEPLTPTTRLGVNADLVRSAAGVMGDRYITINPDITLAVLRLPVGEWICVHSYARVEASGIGQSDGTLFDREGRFGRALKSQLIARR